MATTSVNIETWENVPAAEHVKLCREIQAASGEGGLERRNVGYKVTDLNVIYRYAQDEGAIIEYRLALDLKSTVVPWVAINESMILVLAHMLALSHSYPGCRFEVDLAPDHESYFKKAYAIARSAEPNLQLPRWLGGCVTESLKAIDRPDWLDFRS